MKNGFFKGIHVTGALRLALDEHAQALRQIEAEEHFLQEVSGDNETVTNTQDGRARLMVDRLRAEKQELIRRFAENWLTKDWGGRNGKERHHSGH